MNLEQLAQAAAEPGRIRGKKVKTIRGQADSFHASASATTASCTTSSPTTTSSSSSASSTAATSNAGSEPASTANHVFRPLQALRWTAAGMLEAERQFRKIIGYRDLATLVVAIEREHEHRRHAEVARTPTKEEAIVAAV